MKNVQIALATLLVAAWGCEPQPPEACDTIPDQTVNVRDLVRLTPCFTDPDGDQLTLAVESSDSAVAVSPLANEMVVVRGAEVGNATVTVTATDPDDLQAQVRFGVTVPNRPPELKARFATLTALIGDSLFVNLAEHFEDPDGHGLIYEIGSSDTAAVAAAVDGPRLRLSGRTPGPTEVTVIASDGWDSVSLGVATIKWQATGSEHTGYYFSIGRTHASGDGVNREFGRCIPIYGCTSRPGWEGQHGWSDEIEVGVLREFHIWMEEDRVYVRIGEGGPWLMNGVRPGVSYEGVSRKFHGRLELGMFADDKRGLTAIYDRVELIVN